MKWMWIAPAAIAATLVSADAAAQSPRVVGGVPSGRMVALASADAVAQSPRVVVEPRARGHLTTEARSALSGFSVVLVMGSETGETTPGNLPASAAKALADMKDFLPYKSYRLLDAQWTAASMDGEMRSRLRGPDAGEYALSLQYTTSPGGDISIGAFTLLAGNARTAGARAVETQVRQLNARLLMLERQRDAARANDLDLTSRARANALESEIRSAERARIEAQGRVGEAPRAEDPIINTRFNMDVGETVVVGTSRLQGDKALIVLLTAVGRK